MKPIIVVRHAHPADKHIPVAAHWVDAVLSDLGLRQAECVAQRLKADLAGQPCRIVSSDLQRASQTAAAIGRALSVTVQTTPDLREYHGGLDAGVTEADLRQYVPAVSPPTEDLLANRAAESWPHFYERVCGCMNRLTSDGDDRLLIVVAHFGSSGIILHWWLGIGLTPAGDTPFSFEVGLASVSVLTAKPNGKHAVLRLNDGAHLYAANLETISILSAPRPTVQGTQS